MKTKLLTALLVLILAPTIVLADRPSITSLQQQINQLNARVNDLEVTNQEFGSRIFDLELTTSELSQLVDPLREVCGGSKTELDPASSGGPVSVDFRGVIYNWNANTGGDEILLGNIKDGFYPCVSDFALASNITDGNESVPLYGFTVELDGQILQDMQIYMGDLVMEKIENPKDSSEIIPGETKLGNLVLTFSPPSIPSRELGSWWEQALLGEATARNIIVRGWDRAQAKILVSYRYSNCLPVAYAVSNPGAAKVERATVACDDVVLDLPGEQAAFAAWLTEVQTTPALEPEIKVTYFDNNGTLLMERIFLNSFPTRYVFPVPDPTDNSSALHQFHFRANGVHQ